MTRAVPVLMNRNLLFAPGRIAGLTLPNRMVVAPMTRTSATEDGQATDSMARYYGKFASGGFGLVITEGIYTDRFYSQGYAHQPGIFDEIQAAAWIPVVRAVQTAGGRIFAQLMHAGAIAQHNRHSGETVGPSAVRPKGTQMTIYGGAGPYQTPRATSIEEIGQAVQGFAKSALLARDVAGFDGVEIHGANGYLIDQFLTDYTNIRSDAYSGSAADRVLFACEVLRAVRFAVGNDFPIGIRLSQAKVNDFDHRWAGAEVDAEAIFSAIAAARPDYLHTTEFEAWRPAFGGDSRTLAALAKQHSGGLPVIANGSLHDLERAVAMIEAGDADFVSIGRGALGDASWPHRIRHSNTPASFNPEMLQPRATLENAEIRTGWREKAAAPDGDQSSNGLRNG